VGRLKESRDGVGAGLVVDWDAYHGRLLAGGDVNYIQVAVYMDATRATCSHIHRSTIDLGWCN
jgi:hypothetical protein